MNERVQRLRQPTVETEPSLSIERALSETRFYKENCGKHSIPVNHRYLVHAIIVLFS